MAKLVKATVNYVVTQISPQDCERYAKPAGTFEVLDPDNFREAFVDSEEEGVELVRATLEEALGLSGGVALGNVSLEVIDTEETT